MDGLHSSFYLKTLNTGSFFFNFFCLFFSLLKLRFNILRRLLFKLSFNTNGFQKVSYQTSSYYFFSNIEPSVSGFKFNKTAFLCTTSS